MTIDTQPITGGKMSIGNKLIHVRVNDKLHNSLNQKAKDTNRTVSQYIRDILSTSTHPLELGLPVTIHEAQQNMEKRDQFGRRIETLNPEEDCVSI